MTDTIPQIEEGDLVQVEKGEEIYRGVAEYLRTGSLGLRALASEFSDLVSTGFSISIVRKRLYSTPTEPGVYRGADNNILVARLNADGELDWTVHGRPNAGPRLRYDYLPAERLVLQTTAVKMVRDWLLSGEFSWGNVDKDAEIIRALDEHFGLTEEDENEKDET